MGVKDLWDVLEPAHKNTRVEHLRGKTLAVDLSVWLHQGMKVAKLKDKQAIKPHIRNLFARVCLLLRHQVRPLFVFDGPSPKLKQATLEQRQKRNAQSTEGETGEVRIPVRFATQQCSDLLDCFGLPHITSTGEAEMTCAQLNEQGIVDGCITEDSDVFLFGAKTVYRNFTAAASKGEVIRCYEMSKIQEPGVNLNREKMVVYALLAGCDYSRGVRDVGKEKAVKLLQSWPSDDKIFQRLHDWRNPFHRLSLVESYKREKRPIHCKKCEHLVHQKDGHLKKFNGSTVNHINIGCRVCNTYVDCCEKDSSGWRCCHCEWHQRKEEYLAKAVEISIRNKARADPRFPNKEIIDAFLHPDPGFGPDSLQVTWTRPSYDRIKAFLQEHLHWDDTKVANKVIPVLTSWDMCQVTKDRRNGRVPVLKSEPIKILKSRIKDGKRRYEVLWKYIEGVSVERDSELELITEELGMYLKEAFPELVNQFEAEVLEAKTAKKRKMKSGKDSSAKQIKLTNVFKEKKKIHNSAPEVKDHSTPSAAADESTSLEDRRMESDSMIHLADVPGSSCSHCQL